MGQYWTRKGDQFDEDAEKTANPWAEHLVKGDRTFPDKNHDYETYCRMMAIQQEEEIDDIVNADELKESQPEGVFVRSH